ncbi:MAG: toxin-antitoxin system HicB family antitoxin [Gammaproteobacteria bacterium]|nr:toxin-antitoxin system HicB family antitoxin [Gammaproteobacteria bacterium]
MKIADRYLKLVEWSDDEQCYIGSSPGLIGPCCHGSNETEVYRELCEIVSEWVEIHQEEGLPLPSSLVTRTFSGKFVLRVGQDLHKALAIRAAQSDRSLNNLCTDLLRGSLTHDHK